MAEILEIVDGKVQITPEGALLPEYKALMSKREAQDYLAYAYYMYRPNTTLSNLLPKERQTYLSEQMFAGKHDFDSIEKKKDFAEFKKLYIKCTNSFVQRSYERIKADMENLLEHISEIPFTKKMQLKNHKVEFEYDSQKQEAYINTTIEIDNSDEKVKALKTYDTVIDLAEKLQKKVEQEDSLKSDESRTIIEQTQTSSE